MRSFVIVLSTILLFFCTTKALHATIVPSRASGLKAAKTTLTFLRSAWGEQDCRQTTASPTLLLVLHNDHVQHLGRLNYCFLAPSAFVTGIPSPPGTYFLSPEDGFGLKERGTGCLAIHTIFTQQQAFACMHPQLDVTCPAITYACTRHQNDLPSTYALNATWATKHLLCSLWWYYNENYHPRRELLDLIRPTAYALKKHPNYGSIPIWSVSYCRNYLLRSKPPCGRMNVNDFTRMGLPTLDILR